MKPLVVLISVFGLSSLVFFVTGHNANLFLSGRIAMAIMLVFTSIGHFLFGKGMALMLPPFVPLKKFIVYFTGLIEIVAAFSLVAPQIHYAAAVALMLFFVLLLPANIYSSQKNVNLEKADYTGEGLGYLWFRIPLQFFFIGWVWYFGVLC